jgi:hypothetical protein
MFDNVPIIGINVNGLEMPFLLDTGANMSLMTPTAAVNAGLTVDNGEIMQMQGIIPNQNNPWNYDGNFRSLSIGNVAMGPGHIHIADLQNPSLANHIAGILGADILSTHDLDLDIPNETATIVSIQGCAGDFVPWSTPHDVVANAWINPAENELGISSSLNGTPIQTLLDTGASRSMITLTAAITAGQPPATLSQPNNTIVYDATGNRIDTKISTLNNLTIGDETFQNVNTEICDCSIPGAELQLGEDYIARRHLWLSYGTGQIFIMRPSAQH